MTQVKRLQISVVFRIPLLLLKKVGKYVYFPFLSAQALSSRYYTSVRRALMII
jgi:hypothetical protein